MSSVTLDPTTAEKFKGLDAQVEVRDADGKIIGFLRPLPRTYKRGEVPELTEEELHRRFTQSKRFTTDEVLRRLGERR